MRPVRVAGIDDQDFVSSAGTFLMTPVPKRQAQTLKEAVAGDDDRNLAGFTEYVKGLISKEDILWPARLQRKSVTQKIVGRIHSGVPPRGLDHTTIDPESPIVRTRIHFQLQPPWLRAYFGEKIAEWAEAQSGGLSTALHRDRDYELVESAKEGRLTTRPSQAVPLAATASYAKFIVLPEPV